MKRIILFLFLSLFSITSFSQVLYGFKAGAGMATSYKPSVTPALETFLLAKINRHLHLGGAISFERYSFLYKSNISAANVAFGDIVNIRHKSSYIFFSPKADIGLGYQKNIHLNLSIGGGIFMAGNQATFKHEPFWTTPGGGPYGVDTASHNTSYNIPTLMLRYGVGFSEKLRSKGPWKIMLFQDFGILGKHFSKSGPDLKTSYFSLSVGIMRSSEPEPIEY